MRTSCSVSYKIYKAHKSCLLKNSLRMYHFDNLNKRNIKVYAVQCYNRNKIIHFANVASSSVRLNIFFLNITSWDTAKSSEKVEKSYKFTRLVWNYTPVILFSFSNVFIQYSRLGSWTLNKFNLKLKFLTKYIFVICHPIVVSVRNLNISSN